MIKVKVLIDDTVTRYGLRTEHGLAIHIETERGNVLLDTGQTSLVTENAARLDIDLKKLDAVVLSHGHYDHTGGFPNVLQATGPIDVYAHPQVFSARYNRNGGARMRKTGAPWKREEMEKLGALFRLSRKPAEVLKKIFTSGEINRSTPFEKPDGRLVIRKGGKSAQDSVKDDQCLVVVRGDGLLIFLGCCHSSLINTLSHVSGLFPGKKIRAITGGLHLLRAKEENIRKTIESLRAFSPDLVAACHCTGFKAGTLLYQALGRKFVPLVTGDTITL